MRWALRIVGAILLAGAAICFSYAQHEYEYARDTEKDAQKAPDNPEWTKAFLASAAAYREDARLGIYAGTGGVVVGGGLIVLSFFVKRPGKSQ
jgi:hypothetical protein